MNAELDPTARVYWCVVCGPLLRLDAQGGTLTVHRPLPHPHDMTYDEEDRPQ